MYLTLERLYIYSYHVWWYSHQKSTKFMQFRLLLIIMARAEIYGCNGIWLLKYTTLMKPYTIWRYYITYWIYMKRLKQRGVKLTNFFLKTSVYTTTEVPGVAANDILILFASAHISATTSLWHTLPQLQKAVAIKTKENHITARKEFWLINT